MSVLSWQIVAQTWAERAANSLPGGLVIALFAWALLRAIGRRSSGTRFAVWFAALLAIVALPFIAASNNAHSFGAQSMPAEITLPWSAATTLFLAWLVLASFAILRVGVGFWRLRNIRKACAPVSNLDIDAPMLTLVEDFAAARHLDICTSAAVRVPTLIGFLKPVIILPGWALEQLSPAELNVILLHEFAHLRRWDAWTNLGQKLIRAIFFFHPAVWWIERRLSLEREMACDDRVLAETGNPRAYAECLVSVAEKSFLHRGLALAQAAVSHVRDTSLRLTQILDAKRPGATAVWKPALGIMGAFTVAFATLIPHAPRLIGFAPASENLALTASVSAASLPVPAVMAKAHAERTAFAKDVPARTSAKAVDRSERGSARSVPVQAKSISRPQPQIVPVRWQGTIEPQMMFVVQTVQYDGRGSAIWTLRVWSVTVFTPEKRIETVVPARTT